MALSQITQIRIRDTSRGTRAPARARTPGRRLTTARLNPHPLLLPTKPPYAFRPSATQTTKAGAEANPPEPPAAVLAEGC